MGKLAQFLLLAFIFQNILGTIGVYFYMPQRPTTPALEWWQESAIYQIYPWSHQDSNGDGEGDLAGIESRLDHFVEIGIGAVWISPFYTSPMEDFGYDISNFTEVDPRFGTMEDFLSLSKALKERGIKLIMDFIPNHSSDLHEWFNKSIHSIEPYTNYYVWKDHKGFNETTGKPIEPNNWVSQFGGSQWEWDPIRQQFYLHRFLKEQPDLNFENPEVLEAMLDAMRFWLDLGVDGFRMDAVPHIFEDQRFLDELPDPNAPKDSQPDEYRYWQHLYTYNLPQVKEVLAVFRELLDNYTRIDNHTRIMTVEATIPYLEGVMEYYGNDSRPIAHFPCNFEFIRRLERNFNARRIMGMVDEWMTKMPEGKTANWNVGNHDTSRVYDRFGPNTVDAFNMIMHLLPGSSITYYGEEIGMQNRNMTWAETRDPYGCRAGKDRYHIFSRDPERTPMQWSNATNAGFSNGPATWLPVHENYVTLNVEAQHGVDESHLEIYKKVMKLRKTDVWKYGSLQTKATNEDAVFGFARTLDNKGFSVLVNFGEKEVTVDAFANFLHVPETATVYVKSLGFTPVTTVVGGKVNTDSVTIGPGHSLTLEFDSGDSANHGSGFRRTLSPYLGLSMITSIFTKFLF